MRVKGTVKSVSEGYAIVESERLSACEGCHKGSEGCSVCSLVGPNKIISAMADNSIGANLGDTVEIETETKTVLFYAMLVFIMPVVSMLVLYFAMGYFSLSETVRCIISLGGLILTFSGLWLYSKFVVSKKCDAKIVRILDSAS